MKKKLALLMTLTVGLFVFAGCGNKASGSSSEDTAKVSENKTTINVGVTTGSFVNYTSEIQDFFAEEFADDGIEVKFQTFDAAGDVLTALETGDLDIASTGDTPLLLAIASGKDIKVIGQEFAAPDASAIMIAGDSSIQDVSELKGKKVGAFIGSGGHAFLLKALEEAGLSESDIELVNLSPVDVLNAVVNKEVDAAVFTYQFIYDAEQSKDAKILRDSTDLYRFSLIYTANSSFLENYPDLAKRFLKVNLRIQQYFDNNREEAYDVIAEATGMERGIYDRFAFSFYPELQDSDYEEISDMADFLYDNGLIESKVNVDNIYDLSFLEDAIGEFEAE